MAINILRISQDIGANVSNTEKLGPGCDLSEAGKKPKNLEEL
jgi:hypothetical protein